MSYFKPEFIDFFKELASNNSKDWFDANRKRYEKFVKVPFQDFVSHMITEISAQDAGFKGLESKDCIFRINRDIRFSNDKSPYKLMVSAVVAPNGKKTKAINGVYFEFGPEHVRVYAGVHEIEKDDLMQIREGIAARLSEFKQLYSDKKFKSLFGEILGEKNKTIDKELREAAEKEALIYNKQWYFYAEFPAERVLDDKLDQLILDCFETAKPIQQFFNDLIKR